MLETILGVLLWIAIAVVGGVILYVILCVIEAYNNYKPGGRWD